MALIVPVNNVGDRRIQVLLGSNLLTIRTYWNPTVPGWYMDLSDSAGAVIATGLALVPAINVLSSQPNLTRIYGQFRVFPTDNSENYREDSLGDPSVLWWFAPGEWEENEIPESSATILPFNVEDMYKPPAVTPCLVYLDGTWTLNGTYYLSGQCSSTPVFLDGSWTLDDIYELNGEQVPD